MHFDYIPSGRVGVGTGRVGRAVGGNRADGAAGAVVADAAVGICILAVVQVDRAFRPRDEVNIGSSASACAITEVRAMSACRMHLCIYIHM